MSFGLAPKHQAPHPACLILGPRVVAQRLAREFAGEGLLGLTEQDLGLRFPHPGEVGSTETLRRLIMDIRAARPDVELIHPGVSPWADRPELAMLGQELGMSVLSPPPRVVSLFSNRLNFLGEAERLGVPHLVTKFEPLYSLRELRMLIDEKNLRFPLVLKSIRGEGTSATRIIPRPGDLEQDLATWLEELRRSFGEAIFFVEEYLEVARYVTLPFARRSSGEIEIFPLMDSSLMKRNCKLVEFCPSPHLSEIQPELETWTRKIAEETAFVGLGALEFLTDGDRAFIAEGVPRLNSNYSLWEKVAGTSALKWQLACQNHSSVDRDSMFLEKKWKFGMAMRIYAEDAVLDLPQPGLIVEQNEKAHFKDEDSIAEIDFNYLNGETVPNDADGWLATLLIGASTRKRGLAHAAKVLEKTWIAGAIQTNEDFLAELVNHPWVREGIYHASFVEEEFLPRLFPDSDDYPLCAALCDQLSRVEFGNVTPINRSVSAGEKPDLDEKIFWRVMEQKVTPSSESIGWLKGPKRFEIQKRVGASGVLAAPFRGKRTMIYPQGPDRWLIRLGRKFIRVRRTKISMKASAPDGLVVRSLVLGRIHSIRYQSGAEVASHDPVVMVESLNRLVPHSLPLDVTLTEWKVEPGDWVEPGQILARIKKRETISGSDA